MLSSRTRRAISCVYCDPKSKISTLCCMCKSTFNFQIEKREFLNFFRLPIKITEGGIQAIYLFILFAVIHIDAKILFIKTFWFP